ncbi:unnamed protein product [Brassica oleracea]
MYIALPQIAKQGCKSNVGPENWTLKRLWVCFLRNHIIYVSLTSFQVTQLDLHRMFHTLSAGVIEEVGVQLDKGFGFTGTASNPLPPPVPV